MTKEELRQSYVDAGWTVEAVSTWRLVETLADKTQFDVKVVSPDFRFATAQVQVVDDGGAGETATVVRGVLSTPDATFESDVRDYAAGLEGGAIFAISIDQVFEESEVALATAYFESGPNANTSKVYVIKRRAGTFSQLEQA